MNKTLITFFTLLFCLTSSVGWSETMDDLVERDGVHYKKFTQVPFTGKVDGQYQGTFKNGKEDSSWVSYWDNGQLNYKGNYNNGKREGSYELYYRNGQLNKKMKWKYGFGVKK
jgi:antitoxin component YwqK of YwqJK toxin-antitoxin module